MKILYANKKVEKICSSFKEAKKFFGGDQLLATKLLGRIQDLNDANILQDFMKTNNARFITFMIRERINMKDTLR